MYGFKLPVRKFVVSLKFSEKHLLPDFSGLILRSAFGVALKKVSCIFRGRDCKHCPLRNSCAWIYLFETPIEKDNPYLKGRNYAPHPFVLTPSYSKDNCLVLEFLLVGNSINHLRWIYAAFSILQDMGIGKKRAKFKIEDIKEYLPDGAKKPVLSDFDYDKKPFLLEDFVEYRLRNFNNNKLNVHCITPLRIKNRGKYTDQIIFPIFYKACQRRIKILSEFNDAKYKYIEDIQDDIDAYLQNSRWHELTRYSVRQKTYMNMGGVVGDILYTGDFKKYLPAIFAGEILCVGKNTSFGLGKFEIK